MFRRLPSLSFAALFTALTFLAPTPPVQAGLSDALDEMIMSTSTAPGVYQSQRRGVLSGGAYSLRWPTRTVWLAHIAPPRLSAGCGGIDFFGGSFSFISADQFKQMLRQIGSAAVGYAFQLAIATICQPCSATLSWLEEMMNNINSSEVSSCAIGAKIVSSIASPMKSDMNSEAQKELGRIEQAAGGVGDFLGGLMETFKNPSFGRDAASHAQQSVNATGTTGGAEKIGNITFRVLMKSNVAAVLGGLTTGPATADRQTVEALISLVGTLIYPQDASATKEQGGCLASPADAEADCVVSQYEGIFSLLNLMSSRGDSTTGDRRHQIWTCDRWGTGPLDCMSMSQREYEGNTIDQIVHNQLFGHTNLSNLVPSAGSIVHRIQTGQTLTPAQQNLLSATAIPMLQLLQNVSRDPVAVAHVARLIEEPLVLEVAGRVGDTVARVINTAFSADKDKPAMPALVQRGLEKLGKDMITISEQRKPQVEFINQLVEYTRSIRASHPDDTLPSKQKH